MARLERRRQPLRPRPALKESKRSAKHSLDASLHSSRRERPRAWTSASSARNGASACANVGFIFRRAVRQAAKHPKRYRSLESPTCVQMPQRAGPACVDGGSAACLWAWAWPQRPQARLGWDHSHVLKPGTKHADSSGSKAAQENGEALPRGALASESLAGHMPRHMPLEVERCRIDSERGHMPRPRGTLGICPGICPGGREPR